LTAAIQEHVQAWGELGRETGAFLLKRRDSDLIDLIAWPLVAGVVRSRGQFAVTGVALARIFEWCGDEDLQVAALLHSHKYEAFLSPVDLKYGFAAEGFVSTIVPDYMAPPTDPAEWGWWSFSGGEWIDATAPEMAEGASFDGVSFDEGGVSPMKERPEGLSPAGATRLAPGYLDESRRP
jgi:hypothetical protein